MRSICIFALSTLLIPGSAFAASKEQQEMQRDIAQLQDQVRTLQSGFDQKMSSLLTLVEQALDAGNKTNTNVSVLSASVAQTLDRELKDALRPIAGLTAKMDNLGNDSSDIKNALADLTAQMNRLQQQLTDINNAIKVLQAPPAAPPPSNTNPGAPAASAAPPPATVLWGNARSDYSSGKSDLAAGEFADFVRFYPDDPFAAEAQYQIGSIHLGQMKFDQAVMDFDAVLERYPDNKVTPDAYFMKGMALKGLGRKNDAIAEWRTVARKYPKSDSGKQALQQLRALGVSAGTALPARRKAQ